VTATLWNMSDVNHQVCKNPTHQVTCATNLCTAALNTWGSSVWNILVSIILKCLLDFWKIYAPVCYIIKVNFFHYVIWEISTSGIYHHWILAWGVKWLRLALMEPNFRAPNICEEAETCCH
jgi:hypothetical protein